MHPLDKHKAGLALGAFFGLIHAFWALLVLVGLAKPIMDWIFHLHFMEFNYAITNFGWLNAFWLIIVTAIIGYIAGWLLAAFWNWAHKESHQR